MINNNFDRRWNIPFQLIFCLWSCLPVFFREARSTGLCPSWCTQDALRHPWCHTMSSVPSAACEATPLSRGLWSSGCSWSQRPSIRYKMLLGRPTDLDSPLRILTPTVSAAKLHMAWMISPAKGRGNRSISQSGHWLRGRHPSKACFGWPTQSKPIVVQTGNLSLSMEKRFIQTWVRCPSWTPNWHPVQSSF